MINLEKKKHWYVIQVFSSFEKKAIESLRDHIKLYGSKDDFGDILVPTEEVIEIKRGVRKKSERKFYPGYFLINMVMSNKNWYLVRKVPKIIGFIGGSLGHPCPINDKEIKFIKNKLDKINGKPRPKVLFEYGELVRVNSGPFSDFNGTVEEVDYDKNRLKVSVLIFGRSTPVELDFSQVEKSN